MEATWERKEGYVSIDLEQARRMLSRLHFEVRAIELVPEGRANTNYRVDTSDGPFALSLDQGRNERADFSIFAPEEVPVPQIRFFGRGYNLYDWMPGVTLERALLHQRHLPYEKIARELARVRLALNGIPCRSAGLFDAEVPEAALDLSGSHENPLIVKDPWPLAIEGLLGWLRHLLPAVRLAKDVKAQIATAADDAKPRLQAIAGTPVLVHGDFKPSNLLVDETGLTAVLDWEFAHAGTWLSDVGQLLRHPETLPPGFADAFIDELDAPPDTMLLARTLDLVNLVDLLHREQDQPTLRKDVTARILEVCEAYEVRFGRS